MVIFHVCIELYDFNIEIIITGLPREGSAGGSGALYLVQNGKYSPPPLLAKERENSFHIWMSL